MNLRKILVPILVIVMVSPAWSAAESLGSITSSKAATVRNTSLTPGSTVFSGDDIAVGDGGTLEIAFAGGSLAEVLGGSAVRLVKSNGKVQMAVDHGQASFRASGKSGVEAVVSDISIRPANETESLAVIRALSETHAVIASQKGTLLITTASNGMTYTVREGEAADLSAAADPQQGGAVPAGKGPPAVSVRKKLVIWTVIIVGAGTAIAAYLLARGEPDHSTTILGNEVSPTKLN